MNNKKWSIVGNNADNTDDIYYVFSEEFIDGLTYDIENGFIRESEGCCDCEYADTTWNITKVEITDESVTLTMFRVMDEATFILIFS